jgi:acetylornithine deacetylase
MMTGETSPLYTMLREMMSQRDTLGVSYATDGGHLNSMGLDCVVWGPGDIAHAHQANEFISKEQFQLGGRLLDEIIERWCA